MTIIDKKVPVNVTESLTVKAGANSCNVTCNVRNVTCCLVWCPGQNKRIAPLYALHGRRKRRLKD
jgi:hypothetical protein